MTFEEVHGERAKALLAAEKQLDGELLSPAARRAREAELARERAQQIENWRVLQDLRQHEKVLRESAWCDRLAEALAVLKRRVTAVPSREAEMLTQWAERIEHGPTAYRDTLHAGLADYLGGEHGLPPFRVTRTALTTVQRQRAEALAALPEARRKVEEIYGVGEATAV